MEPKEEEEKEKPDIETDKVVFVIKILGVFLLILMSAVIYLANNPQFDEWANEDYLVE